MNENGVDVIFNFEGRLISIKRFSNETDPYFSERASFILTFRNQAHLYKMAKILSFHHANKIFYGVVYSSEIEKVLQQFRKLHQENFEL